MAKPQHDDVHEDVSDTCDCTRDADCDCGCELDSLDTVRVGHPVPSCTFSTYNPTKDTEESKKLSDYRGKWLIVFFYPADFTFVCPTELGDLADHYKEITKMGADVVSVSVDTAFVHKAWHASSEAIKKIKFTMAADTTHELGELFGVLMDDGLCLRGTFIIDPDGILRAATIHDTGIGRSSKELVRVLQAAQFVRKHGDKVCPANWEPGDDTLSPGMDLVGKI